MGRRRRRILVALSHLTCTIVPRLPLQAASAAFAEGPVVVKGGKSGSAASNVKPGGTSPRLQSAAAAAADAEAAAAANAALERLQPESLLAVLDPNPSASPPPAAVFPALHSQLLTVLGRCLGGRTGLRGDGHVPSPAAWQRLLGSCVLRQGLQLPTAPPASTAANAAAAAGPAHSLAAAGLSDDLLVGGAVVVNVCGRLLSGVLSPHHVAGMLLPAARAVLVIDGAATEASVRREVRIAATVAAAAASAAATTAAPGGGSASDTASPPDIGSCGGWDANDPWVVAALLASGGVGTTVHTPWPASHVANELLLAGALTRSIGGVAGAKPLPLAEAIRTTMVRGGAPPPEVTAPPAHSASGTAAAAAPVLPGGTEAFSLAAAAAAAVPAEPAAASGAAAPTSSVPPLPDASVSVAPPRAASARARVLPVLKERVRYNAVVYGLPQTGILPL